MQEELAVAEGGPQLSEVARVVDTFVAPSKTFTDIRRNASWWLPFVIMILCGFVFTTAIDKKVGFEQVSQKQMESNKFAASQMAALSPEARAEQYRKGGVRTKYVSYGYFVIIFIFAAIVSLLWWATINFAFGATTRYWQIFAIWMFAALPKALMGLLAAGLLFGGVGTDAFDVQNPVGTNLGYYMTDSPHWISTALGFFDLFGLWSLALAIIGLSIVARKTKMQAAIVVVGWWLLGLLLSVGGAAITS